MSTKFLNEPIWSRRACVELREPVRSRGIEPDCVRQNKANFAFLYPCIPASIHSCFPPNKPNFCVFNMKTRFSPNNNSNSVYLYTCVPEYLFLQNKPNLQSSIINQEFRNKANSSFLNPCIPASMYSCFSPNEANLKSGSWPLAAFSLFTFLLFVNRMGYIYNFPQSRKRYYSSSLRVEPGGGKENRTEQ